MANKRTYPTMQQMLNTMMDSLAVGKNYTQVSKTTMLGSHKILETSINLILEAIESATKRDCGCPVCAENLSCLNQLKDSLRLFQDQATTPALTNNLIMAAWFLGNVTAITGSTLLHLMQISRLAYIAHVALAEQIPSNAKPEPEDPKDKPN